MKNHAAASINSGVAPMSRIQSGNPKSSPTTPITFTVPLAWDGTRVVKRAR